MAQTKQDRLRTEKETLQKTITTLRSHDLNRLPESGAQPRSLWSLYAVPISRFPQNT